MPGFVPPRIRIPRLIAVAAVGLLLGACGSLRYYAQAVHGQGELVVHRRAISQLLRDPATDPQLAARLQQAQRARRFASQQLALPDNRSYTGYVALDRPYVVWNVFATPRYSVQAVPQCFPVSGCVAYRGWFREADAEADAARLRARGDDVWIGGVPAYSTLGWFADPILSSMLRWDDDELDGTIFHELAHQRIYVKGDTAFNESFATFVQTEGLREWRQSRGLPPPDGRARAMDEGFTRLVLDLRTRLASLYASGADAAAMEAGKQGEIAAFRVRYAQWRERDWPGDHRHDAWVAQPINNARLLPFGLYERWTPAFAVLFQRAGRHWPAFYASVRELAREPEAQREQALQALAGARQAEAPAGP
ncbi:aminopeptidase [Rhodanobacter sp. B2A1Ga4]|uniref:aminopeptidase n=1 Tax=Rhodanobacter sp. B2A1Ga4 TaxID=2778647 RepID=UPI001B36A445|nr:aminopeptidase [Rhodanobacter sp. B2A1Ga4]MBQ4856127.1 aminopeptidase [Rhodanobacter sp. B2A1Ga4]